MTEPRRWLGRDRSDVFISYCREDLRSAMEVDRYLRGKDLSTWIDSGSLLPGVPWNASVTTAIRYAGVFVAVATPRYRDSGPCREEYDVAREAGKYIVCTGTAPWDWPGWVDEPPPGAVVVDRADGAAVHEALEPRLAVGRLQADLEQAAATFTTRKSLIPSFQGRQGMRGAFDALAAVRQAGLPTPDRSARFARRLRWRLMRWRALIVATAIIVVLGGLGVLGSFTHLGRQFRTSESSRQKRHRITESQSLAAEALKEKESGVVSQSRLLDLAVRAYDQSPTPEAVAALRQVLTDTPHAEDLHAVKLPGRLIAVRLTADGRTAGLTADGTFLDSGGRTSRAWRPATTGGRLKSGWITSDGGTPLVLTDTGDLRTGPTVLATHVGAAATDDDQTIYAIARGATVELHERTGRLRCTLHRPAEVTALAISPKGDALAVGERGDAVVAVNTATCVVRAVPRPAQGYGLPDPLDPIVAVAVADDARVIGFASKASVSTAVRGAGGRYSVGSESGSSNDVQVYLSADGSIKASSYGSFLPFGTGPGLTASSLHLSGDGLSQVTAAQFSRGADGRWRCIAGTASGALFSMNLDEGRETFPHPVGLVADGILTTTADPPWKQPAVLTDRPAHGRPRRWRGPPHGLSWTSMPVLLTAPRGKVAAVAGTNGRITVLGPEMPATAVTVPGPATFTPTGRHLLSVQSGSVTRWRIDRHRLRPSASVEIENASAAPVVAVTALGETRIAVAHLDGTLEIVDLSTATVTARLTDAAASYLAFSPAGDRLAMLTDHKLQLRDPEDLRPLTEIPLTGALAARFAADGRTLAVSTAGAAHVFSVPDLFSLLDEPSYGSDAVAFPALPYQGGVLLSDGTQATVCAVCASADPARLRETAGHARDALRLADN